MRMSRSFAVCVLFGGIIGCASPAMAQTNEAPPQASAQTAATIAVPEGNSKGEASHELTKAEREFFAKTDPLIPREVLCGEDEARVRKAAAELRRVGELELAIDIIREAFEKYLIEGECRSINEDYPRLCRISLNIGLLEEEQYGEYFFDWDLSNCLHKWLQNVSVAGIRPLSKKRTALYQDIENLPRGEALSPEMIERIKKLPCTKIIYPESEDDGTGIKILPQIAYDPNDLLYILASKEDLTNNLEYLQKFYPKEIKSILEHEIKLAQCYNVLGDSNQALSLASTILPKVETTFGRKSEPTLSLLSTMQEASEALGKYRESKQTAEKLVALQTEMYGKDSPQVLSGENALIQIQIKLGEYEKANEELKRVLPLAEKILPEDNPTKIGLYIAKNNIHMEMGDLAGVRDIPSCASLDTWEDYKCLMNKFRTDAKYLKTISMLGGAIENELALINLGRSKLDDDHYLVLNDFCNFYESVMLCGYTPDAAYFPMDIYNLSKKRYGEMHPCTLKAMHAISASLRAAGNNQAAMDMDKRAYDLYKTAFGLNSLEELVALVRLGTDFEKMGDFSAAIRYYSDALKRLRKYHGDNIATIAHLMVKLAETYNANGDYEKAIALCKETLYNAVKADNSYELWERNSDAIKIYHILAQGHKAIGKFEDSIDYYEVLRGVLESTRDTSLLYGEDLSQWFSVTVPVYKELSATYMLGKRTGHDVLKNSNLCKARGLQDRYVEEIALHFYGDDSKYAKSLREFKRLVSIHDKASEKDQNPLMFSSLELSKRRLTRDHIFSIAHDSQYQKIYIRTNYNLNLDTIPKNACFIDYSLLTENTGDTIIACVATHDGEVNAVQIPIDKNFASQCHAYHELLAYPSLHALNKGKKYLWKLPDGSYKVVSGPNQQEEGTHLLNEKAFTKAREELSAALGAALLDTIKVHIPAAVSRWIISPDGVLNNVPFETLPYGGKMVIETKDVSYVPSLSVMKMMQDLAESHAGMESRKELFAMGDAVYGSHAANEQRCSVEELGDYLRGQAQNTDARITAAAALSKLKWGNLPGTAKELDGVSSLFDEDAQQIVRGLDASESNLRELDKQGELGQYKYLLFATHGLYVPEMPELSSIVLSQRGNKTALDFTEDGYITVGEWMGYKLNSDLVYLSACESGLGKYQPGEGVMGIPYGLCVAGNQNTVMSLWKVADDPSAEFSKAFFQKLSQGETQSRALNETKREFLVRQGYENPSIWSAFLLYGI